MNALEFLEFCAKDTWERLFLNRSMGYQPDERMVTGNIITEYIRHRPNGLSIVPITHDKESSIGADIDMWVRYPQGWLRYLIQCKILNFKDDTYKKIDHQINNKLQFDILIDYATKNTAVPLYGFYNYFTSNINEYWKCNLNVDSVQLGITVTDAEVIKSTYKTRGYKRARKVHSYKQTIPIRCLLCCPIIMSDHPYLNNEQPINIQNYRNLMSEEKVPKAIYSILYSDLEVANMDLIKEVYGDLITPPHLLICVDAREDMMPNEREEQAR